MILHDIKRVPPNALLGAILTGPNEHQFKCVSYYVDIQNNDFGTNFGVILEATNDVKSDRKSIKFCIDFCMIFY